MVDTVALLDMLTPGVSTVPFVIFAATSLMISPSLSHRVASSSQEYPPLLPLHDRRVDGSRKSQ
eukprot:COSAG06_NODE_282_length_18378_cov_85.787461_7_plen_64_part_00